MNYIDLLSDKEKSRLSSKTMKVYNLIRKDVDAVVEDVPQSENIRKVTEILKSNSIEL